MTPERPRELLRARSRTFVGSIGLELAGAPVGLSERMSTEARCQ